MSKSGLGKVKRDWSESQPSSSQESPIAWPPSPPPQRAVEMTAAQRRLQAIQEALNPTSSAPVKTAPSLKPSTAPNKRPHSEMSSAQSQPAPLKKARQMEGVKPRATTQPSKATSSSTSKAAAAKPAKIFLSEEQKKILKLVEDGQSVFYTGSAGTGKSVLLRQIIKTLRKKYEKSPDAVAITASTGIAACNIGGVTIHSFAGVGLAIEPAEQLASKVRKNKKAASRWLRTKVLIIDEVSMVDGDLFDKLEKIGSIIRGSKNQAPKPFGGIQIIVTGDFFQLPPVTRGQVKFAFEAESWSTVVPEMYNLTQVFRQRDQDFVDMLTQMRFGTLSSESIQKFRALSREIKYEDGLGPTELFPRREDVDRSNSARLTNLGDAESHMYTSTDGGSVTDPAQKEKMLANFMAPKQLYLRKNAQVMLIKNIDEQLVNGSTGIVVGFVDPAHYNGLTTDSANKPPGVPTKKPTAKVGNITLYPMVEFALANGDKRMVLVTPETWKVELPSGEIQVSRSQFPLILAWAMSIHKSQGQTLDRVRVDLGKVFEKGQAYVALSRATSLEGLQVLNFDPTKVQAHPKVIQWSKSLKTL